jgi:hypothetical protein
MILSEEIFMPSSVIHLLVAKKVNPAADISFYIGNIILDAVPNEQNKAALHLRNVPEREIALKEYILKVNSKNDYIKGIILHLFVDWKWDTLIIADFEKEHGSSKYKQAMITATLDAFHNTEWSYEIWKKMGQCDLFDFAETEYLSKNDIKSFINNRKKWQMENKALSDSLFTPEIIDKFVNDTASVFNDWISNVLN